MKCPACSGDLTDAEKHGVQMALCPRCKGVWLAEAAIDWIASTAAKNSGKSAEPAAKPVGREPAPQRVAEKASRVSYSSSGAPTASSPQSSPTPSGPGRHSGWIVSK